MKNLSFIRKGKEFEPTKDELKRVLDDYAQRLAQTEKAYTQLEKEFTKKCQELKDKMHIIKRLEHQNNIADKSNKHFIELALVKQKEQKAFAIKELEKLQVELNQDLNPVDIYVLGAIEKHIRDLKEKTKW